jgi:hypothetical protein
MRKPLHQARLGPWPTDELKMHLASIVDALAENGDCSALSVVLELLGGELETFLLFGRLGHLDPPRPDRKIAWAICRRLSEDPDPDIEVSLRETVRKWVDRKEQSS